MLARDRPSPPQGLTTLCEAPHVLPPLSVGFCAAIKEIRSTFTTNSSFWCNGWGLIQHLCVYTDCGLVSLARLPPVRGRQTRIKYVISLTGLAEAFRHKISEWLIEEIGVVEEMIQRKAPSV
ncbi:hypothetical protein Taro_018676 [Colocasia esculenta]|uniref:Uncharacterized protein n=1 Tax=Colocasia esculenta TaxID=4460 RepID=A0A843UUJ2_COLES|nr:hypothetical protein [Colocasia esculenta]